MDRLRGKAAVVTGAGAGAVLSVDGCLDSRRYGFFSQVESIGRR
jgi:hypothetical protein